MLILQIYNIYSDNVSAFYFGIFPHCVIQFFIQLKMDVWKIMSLETHAKHNSTRSTRISFSYFVSQYFYQKQTQENNFSLLICLQYRQVMLYLHLCFWSTQKIFPRAVYYIYQLLKYKVPLFCSSRCSFSRRKNTMLPNKVCALTHVDSQSLLYQFI